MDWKETLFKVPTNWTNWAIQLLLAAVLIAVYLYFRPDVASMAVTVWALAFAASAIWVMVCQRRK